MAPGTRAPVAPIELKEPGVVVHVVVRAVIRALVHLEEDVQVGRSFPSGPLEDEPALLGIARVLPRGPPVPVLG